MSTSNFQAWAEDSLPRNGQGHRLGLIDLGASFPPNLPHDFFTPMVGIIGLMEILDSGYSTFTSDEVRAIHRDVHHSALRLNLDVAKLSLDS